MILGVEVREDAVLAVAADDAGAITRRGKHDGATGSSAANTIVTGSGNDVIHGGAGADVIDASAGNDAVDFWGTEVSIDGGAGSNTLVVRTQATIDLTAADQTVGDLAAVSDFQNVDASLLSTGVSITGSGDANTITGAAILTGNTAGIDGGGIYNLFYLNLGSTSFSGNTPNNIVGWYNDLGGNTFS